MRNHQSTTSLDFTGLLSNCKYTRTLEPQEGNPPSLSKFGTLEKDATCLGLSKFESRESDGTSLGLSYPETNDTSLGLSKFLQKDMTSLGLSEFGTLGSEGSFRSLSKFGTSSTSSGFVPDLDESKLSPIYAYSASEMDDSLLKKTSCNDFPSTPLSRAVSVPSFVHKSSSTLASSRDMSLEAMELELQAMLNHIEQLLPEVSGLSTESLAKKKKVVSALSEMESAVKKLSHLSLALSIGSTEL